MSISVDHPGLSLTSAKIIQVNEWGCRARMHHVKNRRNKVIPLAILSSILAQSCVTPLPELCMGGVTHSCASIYLIVLLRG